MKRSGLILLILAGLGAPVLSGCGFTPLYAQGQTSARMSAVQVSVSDGRTGYLLRERLDDELARDRDRPAVYRLDIALTEGRDPRGLGLDNTASRYELRLTSAYALVEVVSGRELTRGTHDVLITYEAVDPPYAGIAAQQDSQKRAAAETARRIRLDLAKYFAGSAG